MPRPILGADNAGPVLTVARSGIRQKSHLSAVQIEQRLRRKRASGYVGRMTRLDAGAHHHDPRAFQELLEEITAEFPELGVDERPIGIVAKCFLGPSYEVHICDFGGAIIEHFQHGRAMPPLFERARSLAAHGAYAFVEVYVSTIRAVAADGSVSVLNS